MEWIGGGGGAVVGEGMNIPKIRSMKFLKN